MSQPCNQHIKEALETADRLNRLADEGEQDSKDNGCFLLYSVVRDCAHKIRLQAERERDVHRSKGIWD